MRQRSPLLRAVVPIAMSWWLMGLSCDDPTRSWAPAIFDLDAIVGGASPNDVSVTVKFYEGDSPASLFCEYPAHDGASRIRGTFGTSAADDPPGATNGLTHVFAFVVDKPGTHKVVCGFNNRATDSTTFSIAGFSSARLELLNASANPELKFLFGCQTPIVVSNETLSGNCDEVLTGAAVTLHKVGALTGTTNGVSVTFTLNASSNSRVNADNGENRIEEQFIGTGTMVSPGIAEGVANFTQSCRILVTSSVQGCGATESTRLGWTIQGTVPWRITFF